MAEKDPVSERIARYLAGQMDDREQQAFEEACRSDSSLRSLLNAQLQVKGAIWQNGREEEKKALKDLDAQLQNAGRTQRIQWVSWGVAAALVILLGLAYFFYPAPSSPEALFAEYYQRPAAPENLAITGDSLLRAAHAHFNSGDMQAATAGYEEYLQADSLPEELQSQARFYLGLSLLEQDQAEEALAALSQAPAYAEQAEWYQVLALLKQGNRQHAKEGAALIASSGQHYYQQKAQRLLEDL